MIWPILNPQQNAGLKELIAGQASDRVIAVIGGAMLDNSLRYALQDRLRPKSGKTDINDKLFRVGGALGNAVPKIDLAYQLYMFEKSARNTMYGISEIRNRFAHNLSENFDSSDEKMKEYIEKLSLHLGITCYPMPLGKQEPEYEIEPTNTPRDKFIVNLKLALFILMRDQNKHYPWSNVPMPEAKSQEPPPA